jgi:hypothetical protein
MDGGKRGSLKTKSGAPMTEAQKEYIITDELLNGLVWSNFFEQRTKIEDLVRSRPYKSDAVLEDFKKWFEKYCECDEEADAYMVFFKAYHGYIKLHTKER